MSDRRVGGGEPPVLPSEDEASGPQEGAQEMDAEVLLRFARAAREMSYSPYSGFAAGAALLSSDGRVFTGTNVENASYGLATCAERTAVVRAVSEGARHFHAIAVVGPEDDQACPPCGSCRQILHEFSPDLVVVTASESGPSSVSLAQLLPTAFSGSRLHPQRLSGRRATPPPASGGMPA